jgi:hypothetical protein
MGGEAELPQVLLEPRHHYSLNIFIQLVPTAFGAFL